jgi:hypothetical protein
MLPPQAYHRAVKNLLFVPRYRGHTIYHPVEVKYGQTKVGAGPRTGPPLTPLLCASFLFSGLGKARAKGSFVNPCLQGSGRLCHPLSDAYKQYRDSVSFSSERAVSTKFLE